MAPSYDDAQLSQMYEGAKASAESDSAAAERQLRIVVENAQDPHLRANASLLLGALRESAGDRKTAISFYRQARAAVPDEPSTHAVLALALAAEGKLPEAVEVQETLVKMTPDDLQAWLILGEMTAKSGDEDAAGEVYKGYEVRRKGLLDGLTLKKDGKYIVSPDERILCVESLAAASDTGTALALIYALQSDPDASVRAAIVTVMGEQRLRGYQDALTDHKAKEEDAKVRETIDVALAAIAKDPVESRPGPAPVEPEADGGAEAPEGKTPTAADGGDAAVPAEGAATAPAEEGRAAPAAPG